MVLATKYWTLRMINASGGYKDQPLLLAEKYFGDNFGRLVDSGELSTAENKDIQKSLLSEFLTKSMPIGSRVHSTIPELASRRSVTQQSDLNAQATAGLCLRCYVSHAIFEACQKMTQQFGDHYGFSLVDILPVVLTDDGRKLILWDDARQTQITVNKNGETQPSSYSLFSVEILRKFNPNRQNLKAWTFLLTRRHRELTAILEEEYGLWLSTPWAILNQATSKQLKSLTESDRTLVQVFHNVYRRDRRQQAATGKCPDPSEVQLIEMLNLLQQPLNSVDERQEQLQKLLEQLKKIAAFLREQQMNPPETDSPTPDSPDFLQSEWLNWKLIDILRDAIHQVIPQQIAQLEKSRFYAEFSSQYLPGLRLIYCERKSQGEIAKELGFTNQSQVSRVLKLTSLINQVRSQVKDKLFGILLKYQEKAEISSNANTFETLLGALTHYIDETVFLEAARELKVGKNRKLKSLFSRQMRQYLGNKKSG